MASTCIFLPAGFLLPLKPTLLPKLQAGGIKELNPKSSPQPTTVESWYIITWTLSPSGWITDPCVWHWIQFPQWNWVLPAIVLTGLMSFPLFSAFLFHFLSLSSCSFLHLPMNYLHLNPCLWSASGETQIKTSSHNLPYFSGLQFFSILSFMLLLLVAGDFYLFAYLCIWDSLLPFLFTLRSLP